MTTRLDGNVLAGMLAELFAVDVTALRARCTRCGHVAAIAEAVVYPDAPGLVARCDACDHVLMAFVDAGDRVFVSLDGLSAITVPR